MNQPRGGRERGPSGHGCFNTTFVPLSFPLPSTRPILCSIGRERPRPALPACLPASRLPCYVSLLAPLLSGQHGEAAAVVATETSIASRHALDGGGREREREREGGEEAILVSWETGSSEQKILTGAKEFSSGSSVFSPSCRVAR